MTAVDVDALAKLREAATAGPWEVIDWDNFEGIAIGQPEGYSEPPVVAVDVGVVLAADAALIVAAVNALPELLAEVRRGRALREAVEALAVELEDDPRPQHGRSAGGHAEREIAARITAVVAAVDGGEQR